MRRLLVVALMGVTLPLSAFAQVADPPTERVDAVPISGRAAAAIVDSFHTALVHMDSEAALTLLADDVVIYEAGRVEHSKAEYASHHLKADIAYAAAVRSLVLDRRGGAAGDLAWIASERRTTGRFNDKPVDQLTTESMMLRKDATGWRITHIHWSSRKAPG